MIRELVGAGPASECPYVMRRMGEFIDITVEESLSERWLSVGWDRLMPAEQELLALDWVVGRTSNSGMDSAHTELRSEWPKAVAGLRRVGATGLSDFLAQAAGTLDQPDEERVRELEDQFWNQYKSECVPELIAEYVRLHDNEFPGPRSLVEVRASMQARGVSEKPRRLIEMERHAAADAPLTDRRCPVCSQPVPTHKSKCRRCGRPYTAERPVA